MFTIAERRCRAVIAEKILQYFSGRRLPRLVLLRQMHHRAQERVSYRTGVERTPPRLRRSRMRALRLADRSGTVEQMLLLQSLSHCRFAGSPREPLKPLCSGPPLRNDTAT